MQKANALGLQTWLSVEPIISYEFAHKIIEMYAKQAVCLRLGKLDSDVKNDAEWAQIAEKIRKNHPETNIFIKKCN